VVKYVASACGRPVVQCVSTKYIRKSSSVILDRLHLQAECCSQNVVKSVGKNCLQYTAVVVTLGEATVYLQHCNRTVGSTNYYTWELLPSNMSVTYNTEKFPASHGIPMTQNRDHRTLSICGILVTESEFSRNLCQVNVTFWVNK
jgi:hypothetical protein